MSLPMRNKPPEHGIRIPFEDLAQFVSDLFVNAGLYRHDAKLLGKILTGADNRCVFSHGTRQTPGYIRKIQDGDVNARPTITIVQEQNTTAVLDGDGGLGYFPSYRGMEMAIDKARQYGVGVVTTRNHFHFGAAGNYSRMALANNCIGLALSSHRYPLESDRLIMGASGGSPMSLAFPSRAQPPLVLDMSASMMGYDEELFKQFHSVFTKSLGLGVALHALGGILAGIRKPELEPPHSRWESNQGAFLAVFNIEHFMGIDEFETTMDRFIGQARDMKPFPDMPYAELPGGMEWRWAHENAKSGVPIGEDHQRVLDALAEELNVPSVFRDFEETRY